MFGAMDQIDGIVREELDDPKTEEMLSTAGMEIGRRLMIEMGDKHSKMWLSKKAYDEVYAMTARKVMAALNREMGLPEDYVG